MVRKSLLPVLVFLVSAWLCCGSLHASAKKKTAEQVPAQPVADEHWKYQNKTTFNAIVLTGNSENITLGGAEKFTAKKEQITDILTSGVTYVQIGRAHV